MNGAQCAVFFKQHHRQSVPTKSSKVLETKRTLQVVQKHGKVVWHNTVSGFRFIDPAK
ncbi:hypothetical protein [Chitinivorax sp. B]|uniref:hypothetical protein n=1 Tax=Chitinivorax sp. B TaxID=2502235 RepID=UPI0014857AE8|nr:hypothetical protein [Chitinivorax sp. B]